VIKLSSKKYTLKELDQEVFFESLDEITCGQNMNPEFSYSTQHFGKFQNAFGGRRKGNQFSVFLYRPIEKGMRLEILAKGVVKSFENGVSIDVRYEIPFWSIFLFFILGGFISLSLFINLGLITSSITMCVLFLIYLLILNANHNEVRKEVLTQFRKFEQKAL